MANHCITNSTVDSGSAQLAMGSSYSNLIIIAPSSGAMVSNGASVGLKRGKIYDILIGTNGTPADNFMEFDLARLTVGTTLTWTGSISSGSSSYSLDPADPGFQAFATINTSAGSSAASIATAEPWYVGINQRASYRWVAAPGSEIVYPAASSATAGAGVGLRCRSAAYTGTATGSLFFQEQ